MTLLDFFFNIERVTDLEDAKSPYIYWSVDDKGVFLLMTINESPGVFNDIEKVPDYKIEDIFYYLEDRYMCEKPMFIPYEELEPYLGIEIEFKNQVYFEGGQKYPLICIRGTCDKQCKKKGDEFFYCFRDVPCTNDRPDCNVWSCKYPNFYDFIFNVVKFIWICPHTDTLIVMFDYTPMSNEPELDFRYSIGVLVKNNKITVVGDDAKSLYKEYNKKYPTNDRQIEKSISEPEENFYFRF